MNGRGHYVDNIRPKDRIDHTHMNCLILDENESSREELAHILLSFGIRGVDVPSRSAALEAIESDAETGAVILDIDNKELEGFELARDLRQNPETRHIKVVVQTFQSSREFVVQLVELGVHGYLLRPFDREQATKRLKSIVVAPEAGQKDKRQHIRVTPDPEEMLRLSFKPPGGSGRVTGKVRNISMGGVAVEILKLPADTRLAPGVHLSRLDFVLGSTALSPSADVVLFREKLVALRFGSFSEIEKNALARYIYRRLTQIPE
jgi:CheY-like chemotaxis protein